MIKLVLNQTGGHKLVLNDLKFLNDKVNEVAAALASHGYLCILSGCVLSQNGGTGTWHNTAGYVIILGEVYYVAAADTGLANASDPQTLLYLQVTEAVASPSPVTYKNLAVREVHYTRVAALSTVAFGGVQLTNVKLYEEVMADKMLTYITSIMNPVLSDDSIVLHAKVVEIGDWDMDTDGSKTVAHGLADYKKIRSISAVIRNDDDNARWPSGCANSDGAVYFNITSIAAGLVYLNRIDGGPFDGGSFDATGYNRGWLHIVYEE